MPVIHQVTSVSFTFFKFVEPLCLVLHQSGITVHASFAPDASLEYLPGYIEYFPVSILRSTRPRSIFISLRSIYRLLSSVSTDVFHVHTPVASYLLRSLLLFPNFRRKVIYTVHGFYFHSRMNPLVFSLHFLVEYILSFRTSLMLFVSKEDYEFARRFFWFSPSEMSYVGNGVDTVAFSPATPEARKKARSSFGILPSDYVIGFVGRLVSEKGLTYLLKSFMQLLPLFPFVKLLIVGSTLESDYDHSLSHDILALSHDYPGRIVATGMINDIPRLITTYHSMDCFCLPSLREGLPTSLIEAMACGLPCIASDIRGCNQLIENHVNGLLVTPGSHGSLTSAISRLITDQALSYSFSFNARKTALKDYDIRRVCLNTRSLISNFI